MWVLGFSCAVGGFCVLKAWGFCLLWFFRVLFWLVPEKAKELKRKWNYLFLGFSICLWKFLLGLKGNKKNPNLGLYLFACFVFGGSLLENNVKADKIRICILDKEFKTKSLGFRFTLFLYSTRPCLLSADTIRYERKCLSWGEILNALLDMLAIFLLFLGFVWCLVNMIKLMVLTILGWFIWGIWGSSVSGFKKMAEKKRK